MGWGGKKRTKIAASAIASLAVLKPLLPPLAQGAKLTSYALGNLDEAPYV